MKELNAYEKEKMLYTCPLHPEVKSNEPGKCPECGMDLVLETLDTGEPPDMAVRNKTFFERENNSRNEMYALAL